MPNGEKITKREAKKPETVNVSIGAYVKWKRDQITAGEPYIGYEQWKAKVLSGGVPKP